MLRNKTYGVISGSNTAFIAPRGWRNEVVATVSGDHQFRESCPRTQSTDSGRCALLRKIKTKKKIIPVMTNLPYIPD